MDDIARYDNPDYICKGSLKDAWSDALSNEVIISCHKCLSSDFFVIDDKKQMQCTNNGCGHIYTFEKE